jgi:hypothetical protein
MTNPTLILAPNGRLAALIGDAFSAATIVMAGFVAMLTVAAVV